MGDKDVRIVVGDTLLGAAVGVSDGDFVGELDVGAAAVGCSVVGVAVGEETTTVSTLNTETLP